MKSSLTIAFVAVAALAACDAAPAPQVTPDLNVVMHQEGWVLEPSPGPGYIETSRILIQGQHGPDGCTFMIVDSNAPPTGATWAVASNPGTCEWVFAKGNPTAELLDSLSAVPTISEP